MGHVTLYRVHGVVFFFILLCVKWLCFVSLSNVCLFVWLCQYVCDRVCQYVCDHVCQYVCDCVCQYVCLCVYVVTVTVFCVFFWRGCDSHHRYATCGSYTLVISHSFFVHNARNFLLNYSLK